MPALLVQRLTPSQTTLGVTPASCRIPFLRIRLNTLPSARAREIERGLLTHLRDLLLELGRGFSFVGSQVPVTVDEQTFYIDLLFYHLRLHRYFVFELKVGAFQPEHAGKLSFYLAAVNRTMRTPIEGPSIGVLLCESRSGPMVEFALENTNQPIGVSTYQVTRELPAPIQEELPSVEDLEEVVNKLRSEIRRFSGKSSLWRTSTPRRGFQLPLHRLSLRWRGVHGLRYCFALRSNWR